MHALWHNLEELLSAWNSNYEIYYYAYIYISILSVLKRKHNMYSSK